MFTYFDKTKKVLCAIQIVDDGTGVDDTLKTVFKHPSSFTIPESAADSVGTTTTES